MTILYVVLAFGGLWIIVAIVDQLRVSRHRGLTREAFIEELSKESIPSQISGALYDLYRPISRSKQFGLNLDDLDKVFGIIDEDRDYDLEELVGRLGMEMPIEPILREWPTEVKTLRDMALWLTWIREHQPVKSTC